MHGSGAAAPWGQYEPGLQAWQLVAFMLLWKLPAGHASHIACPRFAAMRPALHGDGEVLPCVQLWPSQQLSHSVWCTSSCRLPNVPPAHGVGEALPRAQ